jgi:hypothetical protein
VGTSAPITLCIAESSPSQVQAGAIGAVKLINNLEKTNACLMPNLLQIDSLGIPCVCIDFFGQVHFDFYLCPYLKIIYMPFWYNKLHPLSSAASGIPGNTYT